jgi:hypothetical protein
MSKVYLWKNVPVSLQSAIATAKTITGITQANPAVVSCTAHGYSNGDIVYVEAQGMREIDQRVFRVAAVTTDSFALEAEDSTEYGSFISGTVAEVTLGTSVTTIKELSASEGGFNMINATTIHGNQQTEVPGLPGATSYNFTFIWDPANAAHKAMAKASTLQKRLAFKFVIGEATMLFVGYVGFKGAPGGSTQDLVTCTGVFTLNGDPTYY